MLPFPFAMNWIDGSPDKMSFTWVEAGKTKPAVVNRSKVMEVKTKATSRKTVTAQRTVLNPFWLPETWSTSLKSG